MIALIISIIVGLIVTEIAYWKFGIRETAKGYDGKVSIPDFIGAKVLSSMVGFMLAIPVYFIGVDWNNHYIQILESGGVILLIGLFFYINWLVEKSKEKKHGK